MEEKLHVNFRCPKTIDDLSPVNDSLYCNLCEKNVIDFSEKSKEEIIHELKTLPEKPCVIIPKHVVDSPWTQKPKHIWGRYPKSAALITILLLLANVKSLFAQIKSNVNKNGNKPISIPSGYQRIEFSGTVKSTENVAVPNSKLTFYFLEQEIANCTTDSSGKFYCIIENYGGIREVDIKITAVGFKSTSLRNVDILKENPTLQVKLVEIPKTDGITIWGEKESKYSESIVGDITVSIEMIKIPETGIAARHFLGLEIFPDILPKTQESNYQAPVSKLHYPILVTDEDGKPIPQTKVSLWFSTTEQRWGITDANGMLYMNIQLENYSYRSEMSVSAEGYKKKKIWDENLNENPLQTIRLKRKRKA